MTDTPSWVSRAPKSFGEASAGTIKAAEWRSLAMIYLPIALTLAWADKGTSATEQHLKAALDHTMTLFSATRLACLRVTSEERIKACEEYFIQYLRDLQKLHPHINMRTNFHMAIHIPDFLRLFGPVFSWWTFPLERFIGTLLRMPTNDRIGEKDISPRSFDCLIQCF